MQNRVSQGARDYKGQERRRLNRGRRGGSGFFWFITGAVVGAFGVGLAWMLQERTPPADAPTPQTQAEPPTKPNFVFHQLLPEMEVLVPDEELSASAQLPPKPAQKPVLPERASQAERPKPQQALKPDKHVTDGASYIVQVASFRKRSDAERLKAKLALLGVRARLQRVTVDGKAYYRVRTGPFKGKNEVNKTRSLLSSNGHESITIKLK